jgi:hypothetical protein
MVARDNGIAIGAIAQIGPSLTLDPAAPTDPIRRALFRSRLGLRVSHDRGLDRFGHCRRRSQKDRLQGIAS